MTARTGGCHETGFDTGRDLGNDNIIYISHIITLVTHRFDIFKRDVTASSCVLVKHVKKMLVGVWLIFAYIHCVQCGKGALVGRIAHNTNHNQERIGCSLGRELQHQRIHGYG